MSSRSTPISADSIRVELEKILASPRFVHSGRLQRFLRFSVEESLAGRRENLKEYALALEVFDKDATHDPGSDPIVRVEARRLRARLKEYYETDGRHDPIRIDLPKGAYSPTFQRVAPPPRVHRKLIFAVAAAATLIAAALVAFRHYRAEPALPREFVLKRLTSDAGLTTQPSVSPDGKMVAYASDRGGDDLEIWAQPAGGGEPLRLTHHPADDSEPVFSPDSTRVAFRSERNGGGIFVVPSLGGEVRLLAQDGRNPRFSPDGNWIAYWVGSPGGELLPPAGKIFIVPASGGTPRPFQPEFSSAVAPVWSPDGKYLLFEATSDPDTALDRKFEWWTAPVSGGNARKTGLAALLERHGLSLPPNAGPPAWTGEVLVFTAQSGDSANLWQVRLSAASRQVTGQAQRITFGTALETNPSTAAGLIAFASLNQNNDLWSQPVDPGQGVIAGEMQRITAGPVSDLFPSISLDGNRVAYLSNRKGSLDVWLKDLRSGIEAPVAAGKPPKRYPRISPSGSRIVYTENSGGVAISYLVSASGGDAEKLCEGCPRAWEWSPDETGILFQQQRGSGPLGVGLLRLRSHEMAGFLQHSRWNLAGPQFSPDHRWVSFHTILSPVRRQIFVAPVPAAYSLIEENRWIPVTDGQGLDRNATFSHDSSLLYFLSERDGFRCIWAQRLDPQLPRPGATFAVLHLHQPRRSLRAGDVGAIGLSAAPGKLIFSAAELTGNIWIAQPSK